jgi:hypothetical protein
VSTSTAVSREAAWLAADDDLPSLLATSSGPFGVVQAYWPGAHLKQQKPGLYVDAKPITDVRRSNQRIMPQYLMVLTVIWPVRTPNPPISETEQQNLSNALELVVQRIRGPVGDKTHGGAFLSVAENPRRVDMTREDPRITIPQQKAIVELVTYRADDYEING